MVVGFLIPVYLLVTSSLPYEVTYYTMGQGGVAYQSLTETLKTTEASVLLTTPVVTFRPALAYLILAIIIFAMGLIVALTGRKETV
jgi:hypothetical protein